MATFVIVNILIPSLNKSSSYAVHHILIVLMLFNNAISGWSSLVLIFRSLRCANPKSELPTNKTKFHIV